MCEALFDIYTSRPRTKLLIFRSCLSDSSLNLSLSVSSAAARACDQVGTPFIHEAPAAEPNSSKKHEIKKYKHWMASVSLLFSG